MISIIDHGAVGDGQRNDSTAIQAALDACSSVGGGTVLVPAPFTFLAGSIVIPSHTCLHIEGGATLRASPNLEHYSGPYPGKFWIRAHDAEDIAVTGTGTLDGNALAFMDSEEPYAFRGQITRPRILAFFGCRRVRVRDVLLYHAADWAMHPCGCDDLVIDGVTIRNHLKVPNGDGIDPDHCRNVRISNCDIEAGDDGICIKTRAEWNQYGPSENITVTGCIVKSTSCGIKIGTETCQDIRNVTVDSCVIHGTNRGIGIAHRDAGNIENLLFSNCIVQTRLFEDTWWGKAEPIYVTVLPREAGKQPGQLRNVRFTNILCRSENGVLVKGYADRQPDGIAFDRVRVDIARTSKWPMGRADLRPCPPDLQLSESTPTGKVTPWGCIAERYGAAFLLEDARNILLRDCEAAWTDRPEAFRYALETRRVDGLQVNSFRDGGMPQLRE